MLKVWKALDKNDMERKALVKVYHCIQCGGGDVKEAALFCSNHCRRDWYKAIAAKANVAGKGTRP